MPNNVKYKRVLLKLSGEILKGSSHYGFDPTVLHRLATEVSEIVKLGVEIAVVIGGGNLFRGKELAKLGFGRVTGDHMGLLATVMNGLAFRDSLDKIDLPAKIMSAIEMTGIVDAYNRRKALKNIRAKNVVIFSAGTGNPFFTTDTAACLRAIEIDAEIVLKATKVDGVYDDDPKINPKATKYKEISYKEILMKRLGIMDLTAISLCRDYKMPLYIFNVLEKGALIKAVKGEDIGTLVHEEGE